MARTGHLPTPVVLLTSVTCEWLPPNRLAALLRKLPCRLLHGFSRILKTFRRKVRAGRGAEVRLCLYTNYCEALDQRHREETCELWDREDRRQPGVALAADGKRRLVAPAWKE